MRDGQRREVDVGLLLGALAQAEGQPLQGHAGDPARRRRRRRAGERRHHAARGGAEQVGRRSGPRASRGRRGPPRRRSPRSAGGSWRRASSSPGRNAVPTAYVLAAGSSKSTTVAQERVGDLDQDAGAVAGVGLGAGGAAVVEVAQRGERLGHDVVAGHAGQGRHEGDAAGVVLVARVVEPLGGGNRRERVRRGHWLLPSSSSTHAERVGDGRAGAVVACSRGRRWPERADHLSPAERAGRSRFRPWRSSGRAVLGGSVVGLGVVRLARAYDRLLAAGVRGAPTTTKYAAAQRRTARSRSTR